MDDALSFPRVPLSIATAAGAPRFGAYSGLFDSIELSTLGRFWRPSDWTVAFAQKKWGFAFLATPRFAISLAALDGGYAASAFLHVVDLASREVLVDASDVGVRRRVYVSQHAGEGFEATYRSRTLQVGALRVRGERRYVLEATCGDGPQRVEVQASLAIPDGVEPLAFVAPIDGDRVDVSQKWATLAGSGELRVGSLRYELGGGWGGIDVTNGYFRRRTKWRWAFASGLDASGRPVAFNAAEGLFASTPRVVENAAWFGTALTPLGDVRFVRAPGGELRAWRVEGPSVDLVFEPVSAHRERRNLAIARTRFLQVVGRWSGRMSVGGHAAVLEGVPGLAEDQDTTW